MTQPRPRLLVTGASGQLGQLAVAALLRRVPASEIAVAVRSPEAAAAFSAQGVQARMADYDQPESFTAALAGIERVLLISSNAIGRRFAQHQSVIAAAQQAGVALLAYTSILHASTSTLGLAAEHRQTEDAIRATGLPFVLLRNGWYTENYLSKLGPALEHGVVLGGAGEGLISAASRADYAEAAAAALTTGADVAGRVFELAGDTAFTLAGFTAELARLSDKTINYIDLPQAAYKARLQEFGLPEPYADLIAGSDAAAVHGALFDDSHDLSTLIGRPTTPLAQTLAAALAAG